ncbi:hypothetical protein IQ244_03535 [Nostoc sp. LEGE 06077]|uniref:hypothetical protein n=1 Tax=Nostoc sp. LEGE 06077 TaxID=915325 RepID=UPI00187E14E6|nr:hypothetical protein [Nostoc sp. LEGE 06077]MBE9205596.1 hypothetical protein [Nostoc sp. LEGE 06077]
MAAHPNPNQPLYGMITNGSSYLFVKTLGKQYGISDILATRSEYRNNLFAVQKTLKYLGQLVISH